MNSAKPSSTEQDAESVLNRASRAEFARDYDFAFRTYIKAAQAFLHLSRSNHASDTKKQEWKVKAKQALERAELIKKFADSSRGSTPATAHSSSALSLAAVHLTPIAINHLSHEEQLFVLKKGGKVNQLVFPLWEDPISGTSATTFEDPDGQPTLSPEQQKVGSVWRRPEVSTPGANPPRRLSPQEVLQHIITDCSFCASISVCLEHSRRFGSTLAESALHPVGGERGGCSTGRYDIRMLFNGSWRRIAIDDQLPFHPVSNTLMCMSILPSPSTYVRDGPSQGTLWPSLLEKSYMKLMGGYDFPGSNSSIDLHALIGWIPEHIDLKRCGFEREKTWHRIKDGFTSGQCMVTLGTGTKSHISWRDVDLLPSHSYAVIDITEDAEERVCTILDSWVRSEDDRVQPPRELQIPWSEVLITFDGVYLSWDPKMWDRHLSFHGMWNRGGSSEDNVMHLQLQFENPSDRDQDVWVLLTRHVIDTRRTADFVRVQIEIEDVLRTNRNFHDTQQSLSSRGTYTNSTQILRKTKIPSSQVSGSLCISASYEGDAHEVGFTIAVYASDTLDIAWVDKEVTPPYTQKQSGLFSSKNAGGNCGYPSFMDNPQYKLVVHPSKSGSGKAKTTITLQGGKDMPLNVAMTWSQGDRISQLSDKDVVASSGAYTYGLARVTKNISPGEYTIVASTFEPQQLGAFTLKVHSSCPIDLKHISQEGAGMYTKTIRGSWEGPTAAGAPSFMRYAENPVFQLVLPSSSQVLIRLQLVQHASSAALNVTCYPNIGNNLAASLAQNKGVVTSGAYDDAIAGVVMPRTTLAGGRYYIVPSTYNPGMEAAFKLIVYTSVSNIKMVAVGDERY